MGAQQALHNLIGCAVTAESDHDLDAVCPSLSRELDGMSSIGSLGDRDVTSGSQCTRGQIELTGGGRRRSRIDDDHGAHGCETIEACRNSSEPRRWTQWGGALATVRRVSADSKPPGPSANDPSADGAEAFDVPGPVRAAAVLAALQGIALLIAAGYLLAKTVFGTPDDIGRALFGASLALLGAAILLLSARGLLRGSPASRTPIVVLEVLALPVGYSLGIEAQRIWYGGPILLSAIAILALLFSPPARAALDREV